MSRRLFLAALLCTSLSLSLRAAAEDSTDEQDTSAGLPREYADYLIASKTLSPDKKFAVIYPKLELCDDDGKKDATTDRCKDYLVALKPFRILCPLETKSPHFQNRSHTGLSADWSNNNSVVLVILASKWGPGDIFLYELHDGQLTRSTNLLGKVRDLMAPDFLAAKAERFSDFVDFIFEGDGADLFKLEGTDRVRISALATSEPKHIGGIKVWDARFEGVWNIPRAKFTSRQVSRMFAGVRKEEE
jgi:hypothetical protein